MQHRSDEWFAAVERALADVRTDIPDRLVIRQEVDEVASHSIELSEGAARLHRGADGPAPDVVLSCDEATAAELAQGALPVPEAVLSGRLAVAGDVSRLVDATEALAAVARAVRGLGGEPSAQETAGA